MQTYYVFFDLVGTLIYPDPSVVDSYYRIGHNHGSHMTPADIQHSFAMAFNRHFSSPANHAEMSGEDIEKNRWRRVVYEVFSDIRNDDNALFNKLWQHFSLAENWSCYEDTCALMRTLNDRNIYTGIASNFDTRIVSICEALFPYLDPSHIYYSSALGYAKPHPGFFRAIEQRINDADGCYLMIGDDPVNDIQAAELAGWRSVHRDEIETLYDLPGS
jgi:putative hydrolase of the HAD superfamily